MKFNGTLVNNTGADIRGMFENAIREANGGPLPEEIADIFEVTEVIVGGDRRLVVNFA